MATALEQAFINAVNVAASTRQVAYTAAFNTYAPSGFGVFANLAAYQAAIVAADNAYMDSVQSAATTAGITPQVVDESQGVIAGKWASILT
jgi:hypothetical protein